MALTQKQINDLVNKTANPQELRAIMDSLDEDLRGLVIGFVGSEISQATKDKALKQVRERVQAADPSVRNWLVAAIPVLYVAGLNSANKDLVRLGITGELVTRKITVELLRNAEDLRPHLKAVNAILSDAYLDFGNSMNGIVRGAERIFNDAIKQQARLQIGNASLTGQSVQAVAKNVKQTLEKNGFSILVDRGGRTWKIGDYSEMLSRTHLIRANADAAVSRAVDFGKDLVRVSVHGGVNDDLCLSLQGKIFSISGKDDKYPKLTEQPPFHPNCKHTLEIID